MSYQAYIVNTVAAADDLATQGARALSVIILQSTLIYSHFGLQSKCKIYFWDGTKPFYKWMLAYHQYGNYPMSTSHMQCFWHQILKNAGNFICNMTVETNPWHPMTSHGRQDVSNHQHTTVQKLFQRNSRKNKISLYLDWPLYPGNPPNPQVTGGFPHKWPVMLKAFPSYDVTLFFSALGWERLYEDISMMLGKRPHQIWRIHWCYITPILLAVSTKIR